MRHARTAPQAARLAGLKRVSLLQEPVAAAMAFGFGKPFESETILVFDLGGGTYDVSVLDSFEGIMEVGLAHGVALGAAHL
jgi:molecular chaperone HscC